MKYRKELICLITVGSVFLFGCYEFETIQQPISVDAGSTFEINISIIFPPYEVPSTQSFYSVLLPADWHSEDSIAYTGVISGIYQYSQALTDSMVLKHPVPYGYNWWTFVSSDTVDTLHGVISFSQTIHTSSEPGLYFLDYRLGYSGNSDYSYCENNLNPIWVGIDPAPLESDVYVSVDGNDGNTGISPTEPLKTISTAIMRVSADSLNHRKIFISDGEYKSSTNGDHYPLNLPSFVSLIGESQDGVILDAEENHIVIVLDSAKVDTISNMTITGGTCCEFERGDGYGGTRPFGGGGIYSDYSKVYIEDVTFINNSSDNGGGISSNSSELELRNVKFFGNTAEDGGGGFNFNGDTLIMSNCSFDGNVASGGGGGLDFNGETLIMSDCVFNANTTEGPGGGILFGGDARGYLKNVTVSGNTSSYFGGGISIGNGDLEFDFHDRCNIYQNQAPRGNDLGKFPWISGIQEIVVDTFTVLHPTDYHATSENKFSFDILNSKVDQIDQDVYVSPRGDNANGGTSSTDPLKSISYANSVIRRNHTIHLANGVYSSSTTGENFPLYLASTISLLGDSEQGVVLEGDGQFGATLNYYADQCNIGKITITGGRPGIKVSHGSSISLDSVTITGNTGSGMRIDEANATLRNVNIVNNSGGGGGGILSFGNLTMHYCLVAQNTAGWGGGGLWLVGGSTHLNHVTIVDNVTTTVRGGGIGNHIGITMNNSILRDNLPNQYYEDSHSGHINFSHSNIQNGDGDIVETYGTVNWLTGNIDTDPLFCNPLESDYQLAENSPCEGTGIAGTDMGAYGVGCLTVVGMDENEKLPNKYTLFQNYPNPFNPTTTISYEIPEQLVVKITVFDIRGQEITTLQDDVKSPGNYDVQWNGMDRFSNPVSTGLYFCRLDAGRFSRTIKMLIIK